MAGQSQVPYPSVLPVLVGERPELRTLLHQLNNQLGIILANAELLEAKLEDGASRARASQIVTSAVDGIGTARDIRRRTTESTDLPD